MSDAAAMDALIKENAALKLAIQLKDVVIVDKEAAIKEKDDVIKEQDAALQKAIREKEAAVKAKDVALEEKDVVIKAKDVALEEKDVMIKAKDMAIKEARRLAEEEAIRERYVTFMKERAAMKLNTDRHCRWFVAHPAPEVVVTAWGASSEAEEAGETEAPSELM